MQTIKVTDARKNLYRLIDQVSESHEPTIILGKRNDSVIISKEDYDNLIETLYITQNQDVYDSLIKNKNISYEDCSTSIE